MRLAEVQPLQARLGAAYVRAGRNRGQDPPASGRGTPWGGAGDWWASPRHSQALMQIAAEARDRLIWSGRDDVIRLSGDHILAFLGICRYVWSSWSRSTDAAGVSGWGDVGPVELNLQTVGIDDASEAEHRKILDMPHGDRRRAAANAIALSLRGLLKADKRLSYPGRSGFSIDLEVLEHRTNEAIRAFLDDMVDYGVLRRRDNKGMKGQMRARFHLAPWLAPYYQLPVDSGQEPYHPSIATIAEWSRGVQSTDPGGALPHRDQLDLFPDVAE